MPLSGRNLALPADKAAEQNKLLNLQNRILEEMLDSKASYQQLLDTLCQCAEQLVPGSIASVSMMDGDNLKVLSAPSASKEVITDFSNVQPITGSGSCANTIFTSEPTYVRHTLSDPRWNNVKILAEKYSIAACWSHPVFLQDGKACGSFALSSFETRAPTLFQKNVLRICANLVSIISKQKEQDEYLWRMAHHDALTGLPNRQLLYQQLSHALQNARRTQNKVALMFIDLDNFKDINDSYGHNYGDRVLIITMKLLKLCLREGDMLYRHGGDEFLLVLENLKDKMDADKIARKILDKFQSPVEFEGRQILVQFSVGVSLFPDDGNTPQTLLKNADIAMYQAKSSGKNAICYFETTLGQKILHKIKLEQQMREGLARGEFVVYYQAQYFSRSEEVTSLEALIRWNHPERGLLLPGEFIPVSETSSLITEISQFVMREICRQGNQWIRQGLDIPRLAVNFSTSQLAGSCADRLCQLLDKTGFPARKLEIEITESLLMNRGRKAIKELEKISRVGVTVALDDFGTGYSSLSQLKQLPIHKLKIDRSFVKNIEFDHDDQAIVKTVIAMAKTLNMRTVAEGVETQGQQAFLLQEGCDDIQGFYRHRPAPAEEIVKLLKPLAS